MSDLAIRDSLGLFDWTPRLFELDSDVATMRVEEYVEDGELIVKAEIPGIDPDKDVKITMTEGRLRIQARRSEEREHQGVDAFRSEFHYGLFIRDFVLPAGTDKDKVKASYHAGLLTVRIPMPEVNEVTTTIPITHT
ncbi:MAG: Hsp20/alpha crystallin family protein [Actinobacteria bacterium]|nr:Hsp20/alpha crystallin family protein [Actinomycetota bacterium]NBY15236.1 Hsp20/alpha crystallin family protein [Actinomycetota bacterium]